MSHFVIAIDGPAASGKSSVSRVLGSRLGCVSVNSGALYRAFTWGVLDRGIDPADAAAVEGVMREIHLSAEPEGAELRLAVNGVDPSPHLRDQAVAAAVSSVACVPAVREHLTHLLREAARGRNLIMEGRDIGTVVFPDTPYKFYIDADEEVRLSRRAAQGETDSLRSRDRQDATRKAAPLKVSGDALVIDSTHLSLEAVVDQVLVRLRERGLQGA